MSAESAHAAEYRVLLLAPTRRDQAATQELLARTNIVSEPCADLKMLVQQCAGPVGVLLLTDAALIDPHFDELLQAQSTQPPWSDIPVILLCRAGRPTLIAKRALDRLRNVTVLERPTTPQTLLSSVKAGLRARQRQYQLRDQLDALRASESALRARERQLHTLTENSPDILSRFDRSLRHVFVNRAATRLTGLRQEDFIGHTNRELGMSAQLCNEWEHALGQVFVAGEPSTIEFKFCGAFGEQHFVSVLVPERDDTGAVETVLCVTHDITRTKQAELALHAANRRKDEFLAMLAHELRNPLAPIRNAAEYLSRVLPQDGQIKSTADIIRRQVNHMTRLIDDLLDVSRITEGRIELHRQPVDVSTIIADAVEGVEPLMREGKHTLLVGSKCEPLHVNGDQARLVQCLVNILTNAAKYTDPGGEIRIEVRRQAEHALIAISDNGMGISCELLPRVFDLFVQGDRSLDRAQGGLGIGLSLVKRLIQMHGGGIVAHSAGPRLGSSFEIQLPIIDSPTMSAKETVKPASQPRRILIVDDNADAADSLALNLKLDGHKTEAVYRPKDALRRIAEEPPDIILLDIGLPEMDGYEVVARIRDAQTSATVIALTGYGQEEDVHRARAAGFDAHIIKPVDFAILAQLIAQSPMRS